MKRATLAALTAVVLFVLGLAGGCAAASGRASGAALVSQSAQTVAQYQKLELTLRLTGSYANPFDPGEADLLAVFTTPSGRSVRVPGFYYQGFQRGRDDEGKEQLTPVGEGVFKVRFAWGEMGAYRYTVTLRDRQGERPLGSGKFTVKRGVSAGYARRSKKAPLYFELDSGAPYFPIGENVGWPHDGGTYDYDLWLGKLAKSGGNYLRIWMANHWNPLGLESIASQDGYGDGLGRYDQRSAWRVDYILDLADRLDMRVLMCIESFNTVDAGGDFEGWRDSAYNAANGGPCRKPFDFFTSNQAKQLFKRRLQYVAARWGYATSVFAWELWNEVDLATGYQSEPVANWHREMATYLRACDPWAHPITTSFSNTEGDKAVDKLTMLDFLQSHMYGAPDIAAAIANVDRSKVTEYRKPHYIGEFGIHWLPDDNASDPDGLHLHNGLWASMLSGSAGTAMVWWWDSYIEPRDLYHHFAPVAAFARDIDWVNEDYRFSQPADLRFLPGQEPTIHPAAIIEPPAERWEDARSNQPHTFQIKGDGSVTDLAILSRVLHGTEDHPAWHNPAIFQVEYPGPGRFEVMIGGVSGYGGAGLAISLDGRKLLLVDFPDNDPGTNDIHDYDKFYGIEVPAAPHTITVENPGHDWCYVSYRLTNYVTTPNLRVAALANDHSALVWVQNKESDWRTYKRGASPTPIGSSHLTLTGFAPGPYEIERWDTFTGAIAEKTTYTSTDGNIILTTPAGMTTDAAYKVKRK
jgi:hypothetical protein